MAEVGFKTYSILYTKTSSWVFFATFFNTAFVIQIANSHKGKGGQLSKIFNGPFNDYSYDWYGNVGNQLLMAMAINAICPLIELTIERAIEGVKVCVDKGCKCCKCCDKDSGKY